MRWALAVVVLVALTGCTATPPSALSPDEVRSFQDDAAHEWWSSMFPDEPAPEVAIVQYATLATQDELVDTCVDAAVAGIFDRPPTTVELNRAVWTCAVEYPLDPAGDEHGYLSADQLRYGYSYLLTRTLPCLREIGYNLGPPPPSIANTASGQPRWSPYWSIASIAGDWSVLPNIVERCPPPPGAGWVPLFG